MTWKYLPYFQCTLSMFIYIQQFKTWKLKIVAETYCNMIYLTWKTIFSLNFINVHTHSTIQNLKIEDSRWNNKTIEGGWLLSGSQTLLSKAPSGNTVRPLSSAGCSTLISGCFTASDSSGSGDFSEFCFASFSFWLLIMVLTWSMEAYSVSSSFISFFFLLFDFFFFLGFFSLLNSSSAYSTSVSGGAVGEVSGVTEDCSWNINYFTNHFFIFNCIKFLQYWSF